MAVNSKTRSTKKDQLSRVVDSRNGIWDVFKFGESYTSLILGVVAVVVATIVLITFVKGKENINKLTEGDRMAVKSTQNKNSLTVTTKENVQPTKMPSPYVTIKLSPTAIRNKELLVQAKKATPTISVAIRTTNVNESIKSSIYTVGHGDTLWSIAERKYTSGYNWVDIQRFNNLANPNVLYEGQKLTLPVLSPIAVTIAQPTKQKQATSTGVNNSQLLTNKILGVNYTVVKNDTLWDIAVRAYGDGYAWTKISNANKLVNPSLIHSGNKLIIPRG